MRTPAEEAGWEEGDIGLVLSGSKEYTGELMLLQEDDGTDHPFWVPEDWDREEVREVFYLCEVKKLTPQEISEYRLKRLLGAVE